MNKCADRSLSWVPFHSKWIPFFARSRRCPIIVLFSIFLSKSYLSRTFSRTNRSLVEIVLIVVLSKLSCRNRTFLVLILSKSYFSRTFSRTNRTFLDLLVEIPLDFLVVPILLDFCRPDLTRLLSTRSYSTFVTPILLDVLLPQSYSMFCCPNPTRCFVAPVLLDVLLPQSYSMFCCPNPTRLLLPQSYSNFVDPILLDFCCPSPTRLLLSQSYSTFVTPILLEFCCPHPTRCFVAPILLDVLLPQSYSMFCCPNPTRILLPQSYSTFVTPILLEFCCPNLTRLLLPQSYSMFCCPNPTRCFVAPILLDVLLPQSYSMFCCPSPTRLFVTPILLDFCCPNPTQLLLSQSYSISLLSQSYSTFLCQSYSTNKYVFVQGKASTATCSDCVTPPRTFSRSKRPASSKTRPTQQWATLSSRPRRSRATRWPSGGLRPWWTTGSGSVTASGTRLSDAISPATRTRTCRVLWNVSPARWRTSILCWRSLVDLNVSSNLHVLSLSSSQG